MSNSKFPRWFVDDMGNHICFVNGKNAIWRDRFGATTAKCFKSLAYAESNWRELTEDEVMGILGKA